MSYNIGSLLNCAFLRHIVANAINIGTWRQIRSLVYEDLIKRTNQ